MATEIPTTKHHLPARAMSSGDGHFFGYFDKCPWSFDGRHLLAMRTTLQDRSPREEDVAVVGTIDCDSARFNPIGETSTWCWQQGAMLQWLPDGRIIYNHRRPDGSHGSVIHDPATGQRRELPRPVYAVHPNGREAITLDFHRLEALRPCCGYPPVIKVTPKNFAPDDVGLWRLDLETGQSTLICSIARVKAFAHQPDFEGVAHWVNHATYNTDGSRFCFLHRYHNKTGPAGSWKTRLMSLSPDGSEPYLLAGHGMTSHFAWQNPRELLAWTLLPRDGELHRAYWLLADQSQSRKTIGDGVLTHDGHVSYSPDQQWLLTDEYPREMIREQPLLLYHLASGERIEIGRFAAPLSGDVRCDLHARWNREGTQVCFDSAHSGKRQMYVMDASAITKRS